MLPQSKYPSVRHVSSVLLTTVVTATVDFQKRSSLVGLPHRCIVLWMSHNDLQGYGHFTRWFRTVLVNKGTLDMSVNATWVAQRRSAPRSVARGLLSCTSPFWGLPFSPHSTRGRHSDQAAESHRELFEDCNLHQVTPPGSKYTSAVSLPDTCRSATPAYNTRPSNPSRLTSSRHLPTADPTLPPAIDTLKPDAHAPHLQR